MSTRFCPSCKSEKDSDEFYKTKKRFHSWCKKCLNERQKERWVNRKIEAINLMGGKCCNCGYNKNYAALEFHHLNPKEKEFSWNTLRQEEWNRIVNELKKCILLCANCHRETHWPDSTLEKIKADPTISNAHLNQQEIKPTGSCPQCGTNVYRTKYCSTKCATLSRRKVKRPSKEKLQKLLKENPCVKVAAMYGVTDNAIRKWARQYDIN